MKKFISCLLTVLVFSTTVVMAANGDIIGNIYSTDIRACINGVWVDSYNIGGRTVVVLEDITDECNYNDSLRTLVCYGLSPGSLNSGKNPVSDVSGKIVGNIYETDIKTYIRGKEITSYSLDGKMAVAIEDLGGDKEFSDILGRFFWDADLRTISLEFAYENSVFDLLQEKHLEMNMDYDTYRVSFTEQPINHGQTTYTGELTGNRIDFTYKDEVVCRYLMYDVINFNREEGVYEKNPSHLFYYDKDKMEELLSDIEPVQPTYRDWLDYLENYTVYDVQDSFETDDYIFMYMLFPNSHGSSDGLVKIDKISGKRIDYDDSFQSVSYSGNKDFANVRIDRENEKVYLHYDIDYMIDLKTDEIKPLQDGDNLLIINEVEK